MIRDLTTQTPAEIDTAIYAHMGTVADLKRELARIQARINNEQKHIDAGNAEWARRGTWTRSYLVPGGHVHRSRHCTTCYPTTEFMWLTELSGKTEAEALEFFAKNEMILCTVCYPNAPVEVRIKPTREQKEQARQAAARKARIEDPDLIADVDGSELRGHYRYEIIKKVRSAEIAYVGAMVDARWYPNSASEYTATADRILAALAHKAGKTTEEMAAGFADRINKKYARDVREAEKHAKRLGL